MDKYMKKAISIILLSALCFTSCKRNTENVQMDIVSDESKAQTAWVYQEARAAYEEERPETEWEREYGDMQDFYKTKEGAIYFLYQEILTKEQEKSIYRGSGHQKDKRYIHHVIRYEGLDGTFEEIELQTDSSVFYTDIRVSEDGTIILFDTHRAYVYLPGDVQCRTDFPADPRGGVLFQDETHLICQPMMESAYMVFDIKTGEKTEDYISKEFLYGGITNGGTFIAEDGEGQLLATGNGIYEAEGGEWILKVPSEHTSMRLDDFWPDGLWREGEEYFITQQNTLYHYFLAADKQENAAELKIFSAAENAFLKKAVMEYQVIHPDVKITYEFMDQKSPENSQEMDALLKRVNTEIISEQAADIYVLDELPWESYAKKGFLMDIDEAVRPLIGTGEYFDGVLKGYHSEEGTFAMPLFFRADYIVCKKEMSPYVGSLASLSEYLEKHPEASGLVPYHYKKNVKGMFLPMLYQYYGDELYENGKVTRERLEVFLIQARVLYDRLINDTEANSAGYTMKYVPSGAYVEAELWQLLGCGNGSVGLVVIMEGSIYSVAQIYHYDDFEIISTGKFHPGMLIGVHSQTQYPEQACDFLQFLASYTGTYTDMARTIPGIAINRTTIDIWLTSFEKSYRERYGLDQGFYYDTLYGENYPLYLPEEGDSAKLLELLDQVSVPKGYADPLTDAVYGILEQGINGYFEGEKSLKSTVDELYGKISLKQSEEW